MLSSDQTIHQTNSQQPQINSQEQLVQNNNNLSGNMDSQNQSIQQNQFSTKGEYIEQFIQQEKQMVNVHNKQNHQQEQPKQQQGLSQIQSIIIYENQNTYSNQNNQGNWDNQNNQNNHINQNINNHSNQNNQQYLNNHNNQNNQYQYNNYNNQNDQFNQNNHNNQIYQDQYNNHSNQNNQNYQNNQYNPQNNQYNPQNNQYNHQNNQPNNQSYQPNNQSYQNNQNNQEQANQRYQIYQNEMQMQMQQFKQIDKQIQQEIQYFVYQDLANILGILQDTLQFFEYVGTSNQNLVNAALNRLILQINLSNGIHYDCGFNFKTNIQQELYNYEKQKAKEIFFYIVNQLRIPNDETIHDCLNQYLRNLENKTQLRQILPKNTTKGDFNEKSVQQVFNGIRQVDNSLVQISRGTYKKLEQSDIIKILNERRDRINHELHKNFKFQQNPLFQN